MGELLTDDLGNGRVSLTQLWTFMKPFRVPEPVIDGPVEAAQESEAGAAADSEAKCSEDTPRGLTACLAAAAATLLDKPRTARPPAAPPAPTPMDFVSVWLRGGDIDDSIAKSFVRQGFTTRESLFLEPRLTIDLLKDSLGVDTLFAQRRVMFMLNQLWAEGPHAAPAGAGAATEPAPKD
jgi:hypothetical protein